MSKEVLERLRARRAWTNTFVVTLNAGLFSQPVRRQPMHSF